ncbi:MAG: DUF6518 family protein [Microbacterium gubbeenense]|uniref:DUF6518 family protein n=1 Tax=Microbacterium gubbeenense TaxID=159896 RepID=UPI001FDFBF2E|nr:DUF6518 family protein [Microbacterium gubbeenense]
MVVRHGALKRSRVTNTPSTPSPYDRCHDPRRSANLIRRCQNSRTGAAALVATFCTIIGSLILGGVTSYAQGFLPDALQSFANSASGWSLITSVLVVVARVRWPLAALLGAGSFVALTVGYAIVSTWRGFYYDPLMFSVIGVIVGPFVGVAACWLRANGIRAAAGTALLAGIGVGEGVYGLTAVAETTSPVYWIAIIILSAALVVYTSVTRVRGLLSLIVLFGGTLAIAAAFNIAYRGLG